VRLGILPDLIEPASPQQNGAGMNACTARSRPTARGPLARRGALNNRFDQWRREFNELRPHQALADMTPSLHY
jgi:putative transposase